MNSADRFWPTPTSDTSAGTYGSVDSFNESATGVTPASAPWVAPADTERYELRALLGTGGMGRVHLAWDRRLRREVAIKVPTHAAARDRFAREAAITARLEHPGIVPVFDAGEAADGTPWFAMPIVRGRSLATLIREADGLPGRLRMLRHVLAVAETVAFAHAQGAVHRDVKPSNVMVGRFGETQRIDWGLAWMDGLGEPATSAGTPRYMSPAQAAGDAPDPRDDVYSLGALLFECVCGVPAFPGVQSASDLVPTPPPRAPFGEGVPAELAAIIDRALAPAAHQRYANAQAFATDLDHYLNGRQVGAHTYSRGERILRFARRWRLPLGIAGLALVVLFVGGAVSIARIASERRMAEDNLSLALVTAADAALAVEHREEAGRLAQYALSLNPLPDARGVLMALPPSAPHGLAEAATPLPDCRPKAVDNDALRVLCASVDRPTEVTLRGPEGVSWRAAGDASRGATFLARGELVALASFRDIEFLATRDGTAKARIAPVCRGTMQPGTRTDAVLLFRRTCASIVRPSGEIPMPVDVCGASGIAAAAIDQNAARFALACHDGSLHTMRIGTDGGVAPIARYDAELTPPGLGVSAVAFVGADGPILLIGTQQGSLLSVDMVAQARLGKFTPGGYIDDIRVTPDGRFALVDQHIGPEVVVDVAAFAPLEQLPRDVAAAALAPDGSRHLAGASLRRAAAMPPLPRFMSVSHGVTSLAISPDGRFLAVGQSDWLTHVDVATRRPLGRVHWQNEVVKSIDYTPTGTLVAHGIGDEATFWFDDPALRQPRREPLGSRARRIAVLPDHSIMHARWGVEGLRRVFQGVPHDEHAGPALVDFVPLDAGRLIFGIDAAGDVWRAEDMHAGGRFERCGHVPGGTAITGYFDNNVSVVLVMRATDIVGTCGTEAHHTLDDGAAWRDDMALTAFAAARGWVAAGSRDGIVRLWRRGESVPFAIRRNHTGRVAALVIDPEARWFASGGWDARVMFWTIPDWNRTADGAGSFPPSVDELLEILRRARTGVGF